MPKYAYIRSSEYGGIHQINRDVGASKQIHGIRTERWAFDQFYLRQKCKRLQCDEQKKKTQKLVFNGIFFLEVAFFT